MDIFLLCVGIALFMYFLAMAWVGWSDLRPGAAGAFVLIFVFLAIPGGLLIENYLPKVLGIEMPPTKVRLK